MEILKYFYLEIKQYFSINCYIDNASAVSCCNKSCGIKKFLIFWILELILDPEQRWLCSENSESNSLTVQKVSESVNQFQSIKS